MKNLDLKGIKKALRKIERKRIKARKDNNCRLYRKVNKKYRNLPWHKDTFQWTELKETVEGTCLPVFRKMRNYGWVRWQHKETQCVGEGHYLKSNIENLFLLQELMCQMDDDYWFPSKSNKSSCFVKYSSFYFDSVYLGRCFICSYPKTLEWKEPLLTQFLKDREYIFDERTQYGRPLKDIRKFVGKTLIKSKVEKWDYYFQRFIRKSD